MSIRVLVALLVFLLTATTTASAATFTYDALQPARVDARGDGGSIARLVKVSLAREGSASRPGEAHGASTTPSAAVVATEEGLPALRQAYVDDVGSISDNVTGWEKAGANPEEVAREVWADRRALGIQYKELTPSDVLQQITERNIAKYGDPLGPSVDWLRAQGKTWQQIIESATRPGGQDLGF